MFLLFPWFDYRAVSRRIVCWFWKMSDVSSISLAWLSSDILFGLCVDYVSWVMFPLATWCGDRALSRRIVYWLWELSDVSSISVVWWVSRLDCMLILGAEWCFLYFCNVVMERCLFGSCVDYGRRVMCSLVDCRAVSLLIVNWVSKMRDISSIFVVWLSSCFPSDRVLIMGDDGCFHYLRGVIIQGCFSELCFDNGRRVMCLLSLWCDRRRVYLIL
jgi:hypothetical protein